MSANFIYQQDTVKTKNLLKLVPDIGKTSKLQLDRVPISLDSLPERKIIPTQADTIKKLQAPTLAQIRYWQRQRENKLLVDGSRFIKTKQQVELHTTSQVDSIGLGLPANEINRMNTDWLTILLILIL